MIDRLVCVLAATLLLAGCALSPQVISLQPALDAAALPRDGAATALALTVADVRANAIVGHRGGVYETATITVAEDAAARLQAGLATALAARGFSVVATGKPAAIDLRVELAELGYKSTQGQVTRTVEVTATVRARSQAGEVTRSGEYRDTRSEQFVKPPSDAQNESLINDVVSAVLQRLVADAELLKF